MILNDITLNPDAQKMWLGLIEVSHLWDDFIDKDREVPREEVDRAFWFLLVDLPNNPYYRQYQGYLQPIITASCIDYIASVNMEEKRVRNDVSHVLRFKLCDVIQAIALIENGPEFVKQKADDIWLMCVNETFEEYAND